MICRAIVRLWSRRKQLLSFRTSHGWVPYRTLRRFVFLIWPLFLFIVQFYDLRHHYLTMPLQHCYLSLWTTSNWICFLAILMTTRLFRVNTILSSWSAGVSEFIFNLSPSGFCLMLHIWLTLSIRPIVDIAFPILYACEPTGPRLNPFFLTKDIIRSVLRLLWKFFISIMIYRSFQRSWNTFHMCLKTEIVIHRVLHRLG